MAKEIDFSNVFDGVQTRPIVGEERVEAEKTERKKVAGTEKAGREKTKLSTTNATTNKNLNAKQKKGSKHLQEKKITICFSNEDYEKIILKVLKLGLKDKKPLQLSVYLKKIIQGVINEK